MCFFTFTYSIHFCHLFLFRVKHIKSSLKVIFFHGKICFLKLIQTKENWLKWMVIEFWRHTNVNIAFQYICRLFFRHGCTWKSFSSRAFKHENWKTFINKLYLKEVYFVTFGIKFQSFSSNENHKMYSMISFILFSICFLTVSC